MPVVDGDMPLVLRMLRSPAPSSPGPGALSGDEADANWTMLKAAILVLAAEKLDASAATPIEDVEEPESGDFLILYKAGIPYFMLVDDVMGGSMTAEEIRDALETLTTTGRLDASAIQNLPEAGYATAAAVRDALATLSGADRLDATAIKNLSSGEGGSAADPMGLWDYWYHSRFGNNNVAANDMFLGAAISSGTNSTAIPTGGMAGYNTQGVFLRSSTSANGGYKYQTSSLVADYFGTISHKFRGQFLWRTAFTNVTVRLGFHDTATSADATDGAYFEIVGATCSAKTANNSTRTTHGTTATLSLDVAYTFDIDVNAAGTEARFRVYAGNSPTPILDVTNTTNIPTTSARAFGAGIVATESTTTASDIGILYSMGVGTVEGFARVNGVLELVPDAFEAGDWTATAGDEEVDLDLTALPSAGSGVFTELQYRVDGGTATALTGLGTGVRTITGLTNDTEYDFEIRAANEFGPGPWSDVKSRTPVAAGGGGAALFVQTNREFQGFGTSQAVTLSATGAGNMVVVCAIVPNARTISSVVGSDAGSFGTLLHSEVFGSQTHYYYARPNCPSITSATVTISAGDSFDVIVYEWSGLGATIALDFGDGNTVSSATSTWEMPVTTTVADTAFMANIALTLDAWPVGAGSVVAAPASSDYSIRAYAALASSGAQTPTINMTTDGSTPANREGDRSWIVIRADS